MCLELCGHEQMHNFIDKVEFTDKNFPVKMVMLKFHDFDMFWHF